MVIRNSGIWSFKLSHFQVKCDLKNVNKYSEISDSTGQGISESVVKLR